MNELLTMTIAVILSTLHLIPGFIVLGVLFPARLALTQANANSLPVRSFFIGMVNFIFFAVIAVVLFALAERSEGFLNGLMQAFLALFALIVVAILFVSLGFGLAGVARLIGERLAPSQSAWRQMFWGTLLLGLGGSLPLVGWLLLFYAAWVGLGAFIISFFQRKMG